MKNKSKSAAEILMAFFRYYTTRFDTKSQFVNVTGVGAPFESKQKKDEFFDLDETCDFVFLVRDPFNKTYNCAKQFILDRDFDFVQKMFQKAQ